MKNNNMTTETKQEQRYKEGDKVRVVKESKIFRGLEVITLRPGDVLRVVGYDRFGDVCARFDDCADKEALHDAFFGKFYLSPKDVEPVAPEVKPNSREPKSYKAVVLISGACEQNFYGTKLETLTRRATKALTHDEPGYAGLTPQCFILMEKVREISGNRSQWRELVTVKYSEIKESELEWKRRKLERETKLAMERF